MTDQLDQIVSDEGVAFAEDGAAGASSDGRRQKLAHLLGSPPPSCDEEAPRLGATGGTDTRGDVSAGKEGDTSNVADKDGADSENLSDLEDAELDELYVLNEEEQEQKAAIWHEVNKDYLPEWHARAREK